MKLLSSPDGQTTIHRFWPRGALFFVWFCCLLVLFGWPKALHAAPRAAPLAQVGCSASMNVSTTAELNNAISCYNSQTTAGVYTITFTAAITLETASTVISNTTPSVALQINGNNKKLDGALTYRGLEISANTRVTMSRLTILYGKTSASGGGIVNHGTLMVSNSTLSSNEAELQAGGIWNDGSLTVSNSTLNDNISSDSGGGISSIGPLTVSNSTLNDNWSTNGGGGISSTGPLMVSNSTLSNNFAANGGGGIYNTGILTVTNSTLSGNSAMAGFGAGILNSGQLALRNTIIADSQNGDSCRNNGAGTITSQTHNLLESSGNFACGIANGSNGSIIGQSAALAPLAGNGAGGQTHALLDTSPALDQGDAAICAAAPINNRDQRGITRPQGIACDIGSVERRLTCPAGGVLYVKQGATGKQNGSSWADAFANLQDALQVTAQCQIWVAKGVYYPDQGSRQKDNRPEYSFNLGTGLAIYGGFAGTESNLAQRNWQTNVTVLSGDLEQNDTGKVGDVVASNPISNLVGTNAWTVVRVYSGFFPSRLDGFTITAGLWQGMNNSNPKITLTNLIFSGNQGVGLFNKSDLTLTDSLFRNNDGGGLANEAASNLKLLRVSFNDNSGYLGGGLQNKGNLTLTEAKFMGNQATNGGGLYSSGNLTLTTAVTFTNNVADLHGGGLYLAEGSRAQLSDVTLSGNRSKQGNGGGMALIKSTVLGANVTLNDNQADSIGGGMYTFNSTVTLTHVKLNNNKATTDRGGGLYALDSVLKLNDAAITHNHAGLRGGGMSIWDGSAQLSDVTITDNTSDGDGGGMYIWTHETSTELTNVTIAGNRASEDGGGIANEGIQTLTNVTIAGNRATKGGGLYNFHDQRLINVTVSGNRASYSGGIENAGKLALDNSIVWGNAASFDPQLYNDTNSTFTINYSLVEGQNPAGVGNLDGANAANNPNFVAPQTPSNAPTAAGDYRRQPVSPATDEGNDAVNPTATDLAGRPRKQGTIDLGAYENASVLVDPDGVGIGEPNGTASFTVTLTSAPTADVTINLTSSDPGECSVPSAVKLTPANWQTGVAVPVSAVDDTLVDGPQPCTIQTSATSSTDPAYTGVPVEDVSVTVADNEKPGVVVNPTTFTLQEASEEKQFVIKLLAQPVAPVTIDLASDNPDACSVTPTKVTLDANNWQIGAAAIVKAVEDDEITGNRSCTIETNPTSSPNTPYDRLVVDDVTVKVIDNDVAGMTSNPAAVEVSEPDGTARFTLKLKSKPTADVLVALTSSISNTCSVPTSVTLTPTTWQTGAEVTVSAVDNRIEEGDHACTVTALTASTDINYEELETSITVTVHDDDYVQVVTEPTGLEVEEPNSTASFTVTLTKAPIAAVKINLASSAADECNVTSPITLDATNWQKGLPVTVSAVDDALLDGPQTCLITSTATSTDPAYDGRQGKDVTVKVADNEEPELVVSPDQLTIHTPNGSASFTAKLTIPPTTPVSLALSSDNPACSVPDNVTPTANGWQTGTILAVTAVAPGPQVCVISVTTSSDTPSYDKLSEEVNVTVTEPNATLTVLKESNGSGTVTSNPAGINCDANCRVASAPYARNTPVTLTATPAAGSTFDRWSGACTGNGACQVTLDRAKSVTAIFNKVIPPPKTLTLSKAGSGSGEISTSAGFNCSASCTEAFDHNTTLTLTATPAAGSTFAGWSGGVCTGTGPCQVTLDSAKSVVATFTLIPPTTQTLSVTKAGNGTGKVTGAPAGLDCGPTCKFVYNHNAVVTLTATPDSGSVFMGWSGGGCSGSSTCQVTLDASQTVIANFATANVTTQALTVNKVGSGAVKSNPVGIDCGTACSFAFAQDKLVTLTATPASGSPFVGWSGGGCSGTGACVVTMNSAKTVTATFNTVTSALPTLTVSKAGGGTGKVNSSPAGIDCGATCSASFAQGAAVTLTAAPDAGSTFAGWSGACTGTGACQVTLDAAKSVVATFTKANATNQTLTVSKAGSGSGTVKSTPTGIDCNGTCSAPFTQGAAVTLTATPDTGSTFAGWSGACSGATATCTVTLDNAKTVTATFNKTNPTADSQKIYLPTISR